jgi:hypothetical protein
MDGSLHEGARMLRRQGAVQAGRPPAARRQRQVGAAADVSPAPRWCRRGAPLARWRAFHHAPTMPRTVLLLVLSLVATAGEVGKNTFVNSTVSDRTIALNQPVRVEFTTLPRQVEITDAEIARRITDAVGHGSAASWRLLGAPMVVIDKQKTVTVTLQLLPRLAPGTEGGPLLLPEVPLPWLAGTQSAAFGQVEVKNRILVNGELRPLPSEITQVGGFTWGAKFDDLRPQLADVKVEGGRTTARPLPGMELEFRGGELCAAQLLAANLDLERARAAFIERWGGPHREEFGEQPSMTWHLGWTRITATPATGGVRVALAREDAESRLAKQSIQDAVFGPLDGKKP